MLIRQNDNMMGIIRRIGFYKLCWQGGQLFHNYQNDAIKSDWITLLSIAQHFSPSITSKQKLWSDIEQCGQKWFEHVSSQPDWSHTLQSDIYSFQSTSQAGWWYPKASGGRWGTMSLLCTTLQMVSILVLIYCARAGLANLGLPQLWITVVLLYLALSLMAAMIDSAAPRLCPVVRIVAVGCACIRLYILSLIFISISKQSNMNPACISQPLHAGYLIFSTLKSSSQLSMFLEPRQETMIMSFTFQQPIKHEERLMRLVTWVTSPKLVRFLAAEQFQAYRHFLGQYARPAKQAYSVD